MLDALILLALIAGAVATGYEALAATRPHYRKGCNECDAVQRRERERQEEVNHDYAHTHGFGCRDKACPRNKSE